MHKAALLSLITPLLLVACDGIPEPRLETSIHLSSSSSSHHDTVVSKVLVTLTHIEVYSKAQRRWRTVASYGSRGRMIDLLTLHCDNPQGVGAFELAAGRYEDIRLHTLETGSIEVDEGSGPVVKPLEVRSDDRTGIEVDGRFDVVGQGLTQVGLDFDARKSIKTNHRSHKTNYSLKAEIDVIGATTSTTSAVAINAAQGGEVHLLGRADLIIPPGALRADTVIEASIVNLSAGYTSKVGLLPGNIIKLEPGGLTFEVPATLDLYYSSSELPAGMTADDLSIVSRDPGTLWTGHASTSQDGALVLSTEISHLGAERAARAQLAPIGTVWAVATSIKLVCPPGSSPTPSACNPPSSPVTTDCLPTKDVKVRLFDSASELFLRNLNWSSDAGAVASVRPTSVDCASIGDQAACDLQPGCLSDEVAAGVFGCIVDPRFKTVQRNGCGTATLTVLPACDGDIPCGEPGVQGQFGVDTKDTYRATLDTILVHEDSDPYSDGELYWDFSIGPTTISHRPITNTYSIEDVGTIHVNESQSIGPHCENEELPVGGKLYDEDGFDDPESSPPINATTRMTSGSTRTGGEDNGDPDGTFSWSIVCTP